MPLKLISTEQELEWFHVYYNEETQKPWPTEIIENGEEVPLEIDDETAKLGTSSFGLRRLAAGDMKKITNQLYSMNRRGKSSFEYGTASQQKILAACKKAKNIGNVDDPKRELEFTKAISEQLPNWVFDKLLEQINEVNNLAPDDVED